MFDWVENRLQAKGLKYWARSCSQSSNLCRENTQQENMCDIIFKNTKGIYAEEATVERVLWKRCYEKFRRIHKKACAGISFYDKVKLCRSAASVKERP